MRTYNNFSELANANMNVNGQNMQPFNHAFRHLGYDNYERLYDAAESKGLLDYPNKRTLDEWSKLRRDEMEFDVNSLQSILAHPELKGQV